MRTIRQFTADSIQRIADAVRLLDKRIGNLERRLASRSWPYQDHLKPKCHFTLSEALDTTDEFVTASIETQYGQGSDHTDTSITVYNLPTHVANTYEFYGDSGDWGIASYSGESNVWYIDIVECP